MSPEPVWSDLREDLRGLHQAALAAANPERAVERLLGLDDGRLRVGQRSVAVDPAARVWLIAIGKASCGMARAALSALGGRIAGGLIAHPRDLEPGVDWPAHILRFPAGHPLPDEGSLGAGEAALELMRSAAPRDLVLVLVSGGGSALFEALRPGVTLADLRHVTDALQRAGADIVELNTVRRALSRVKGGGLGRAAGRARVVTLLLSDVVGDRLEAIASGPTIESPTGPGDAVAVLERRAPGGIPPTVMNALREAARVEATPGPTGDRIAEIVGSNRIATGALCAEARARGFQALLLSDRMQGEAREIGRLVGGMARAMRESSIPFAPPACLVLGGETTVTVRGRGRGGRNLELALGAALALDGTPHAAVFSFATDGLDGSSGAAGAVATGDTLARARDAGLSAQRALDENDTEYFFRALDDLWITGRSGTNVNDVCVALAYR
jgi:hydroxypyruvate reductase